MSSIIIYSCLNARAIAEPRQQSTEMNLRDTRFVSFPNRFLSLHRSQMLRQHVGDESKNQSENALEQLLSHLASHTSSSSFMVLKVMTSPAPQDRVHSQRLRLKATDALRQSSSGPFSRHLWLEFHQASLTGFERLQSSATTSTCCCTVSAITSVKPHQAMNRVETPQRETKTQVEGNIAALWNWTLGCWFLCRGSLLLLWPMRVSYTRMMLFPV